MKERKIDGKEAGQMKKIKADLLLLLTLPVLLASLPLHQYLNMLRSTTYSTKYMFFDAALYFIVAALFVLAAIEIGKARKTRFAKIYTTVVAAFLLLVFLLFFMPVSRPFGLANLVMGLAVSLGYDGIACCCAYYAVLSVYTLTGKEKAG